MIIEKATHDDLQAILELQYLAFQREAELFHDFSIEPLRQTIAEVRNEYQRGPFLKAVDANGAIIGSVRATLDGATAVIRKCVVHPELQGRGIGTQLLAAIERACSAQRYELSASIRCPLNIKLYERLGYQKFKEERSADNGFVYLEKHVKEPTSLR